MCCFLIHFILIYSVTKIWLWPIKFILWSTKDIWMVALKILPLNNFWFIFLFKLPNLICHEVMDLFSNCLARSISFSYSLSGFSKCLLLYYSAQANPPCSHQDTQFPWLYLLNYLSITPHNFLFSYLALFLSSKTFSPDNIQWIYLFFYFLPLSLDCEIEDTISPTLRTELCLRHRSLIKQGWIYLKWITNKDLPCRKGTLLSVTWQPG